MQGWNVSFATPRPSPHHKSFSSTESSMCESPPLKQPRLFTPPPLSPSTATTTNKRRQRHCLATPLDYDLSPPVPPSTPNFVPKPYQDSTNRNRDDVMVCSPPRIERLQLFDFPATPQTLARGAGVLSKGSILSRLVSLFLVTLLFLYRNDVICYRVRRSARVTRSGPELRRKQSRGTNINPFTPKDYQTAVAARKRIQRQA